MNNRKQNALIIITPGFPADENDSTCLPPQQVFVKALKRENPNLNVIVLSLQYPFFSSEYEWNGIKVFSFGAEKQGQIYRWLTFVRVYLKLRKLKKQFQIIGLLSFWFNKAAFIAHYFAKFNQLQHFCWLLGQDALPGNRYVRYIQPKASSLIALSDFLFREFEKNYQIKPQNVITVGIDQTQFLPLYLPRDIDVLGVGSLIPLKQYAVFLNILKAIIKNYPNLKAVICGDGEEMEKLKKLVQKLELSAHVTLVGRLPHAEILILMQRTKIFLHTSAYEGFGAVNLEALYAGAKVVSFVKPMDQQIDNWYQVANENEAVSEMEKLLAGESAIYPPVLPFPIKDVVKAILLLYNYKETATS